MKKNYQKPVLDIMYMEQESMMAASSIHIYEDTIGASDALSNEESDINVWN